MTPTPAQVRALEMFRNSSWVTDEEFLDKESFRMRRTLLAKGYVKSVVFKCGQEEKRHDNDYESGTRYPWPIGVLAITEAGWKVLEAARKGKQS